MVFRGIAQLVEQRSPKPRAVSSSLTTPAKNPRTIVRGFLLFTYSLFTIPLKYEDFWEVKSNME